MISFGERYSEESQRHGLYTILRTQHQNLWHWSIYCTCFYILLTIQCLAVSMEGEACVGLIAWAVVICLPGYSSVKIDEAA